MIPCDIVLTFNYTPKFVAKSVFAFRSLVVKNKQTKKNIEDMTCKPKQQASV